MSFPLRLSPFLSYILKNKWFNLKWQIKLINPKNSRDISFQTLKKVLFLLYFIDGILDSLQVIHIGINIFQILWVWSGEEMKLKFLFTHLIFQPTLDLILMKHWAEWLDIQ